MSVTMNMTFSDRSRGLDIFCGTYRSEDKGETWTKMSSTNPRPMYYSKIRIDPNNDFTMIESESTKFTCKMYSLVLTPNNKFDWSGILPLRFNQSLFNFL